MTAGAVVEVEATTSTLPVVPRRVQSALASAAGAADGHDGVEVVVDDAAEPEPASEPHAAIPIVNEATATGNNTRRKFTCVTLPTSTHSARSPPRHQTCAPHAREYRAMITPVVVVTAARSTNSAGGNGPSNNVVPEPSVRGWIKSVY